MEHKKSLKLILLQTPVSIFMFHTSLQVHSMILFHASLEHKMIFYDYPFQHNSVKMSLNFCSLTSYFSEGKVFPLVGPALSEVSG